jgi:dTMP kinase
MAMRPGKFISLEGIDGAGKSTHAAWLAEHVRAAGDAVVVTREPGGTPVGERLRDVLLHEPMSHDGEALLMFCARREHVDRVIRPALARGEWVISDRFTDATFAYQGGGHGVPMERLAALEEWILGGFRPDLTILFDVPPEVSRARLDKAERKGRVLDKFEREAGAFFARVRDAYLARARAEPDRFRVVDSTAPVDSVRRKLERELAALAEKIA